MLSKCLYLFFFLIFNLFVCFSNALPRGESVNLACSIMLPWLDGNIYSPVRYSDLPFLRENNSDIFTAFLLILPCSFSSLILSSIVIGSFYILPKRFFQKRERLFNVRVVSITKEEYGFAVLPL